MSGPADMESGYPAAPPPPEPMFDMVNSSTSGLSVDDENPGLDRGHSLPNVDELKMDHKAAKSSEFVTEDGEVVKRRGGWVVWLALFLAVVVIAIIIGVAVAVTNNKDSNKNTASSSQASFTPAPVTIITPSPVTQPRPTSAAKPTGNDVTPAPASETPATPPPSTPAPQSTPAPVGTAATRTADFKDYLIQNGISTEADLNTDGSPQQKALNFIAVDDTAQVPLPAGNKGTPEGYAFMARYVLTLLFYSTMGDRWVYTLNFLQPYSFCYWNSVLQYPDLTREYRGVACTETGELAALFMTRNNMEGTLPAEMGLLTTLAAVDFNFNLLRGDLPDSFKGLTKMQNLFIMSNRLTGTLPSWMDSMVSLRNINLSHNLMTGRLPTTLGNLQNVKGIALDNNLFTNNLDGVFDTSVVPGFRKLEQLYLENNQFTGSLGVHFGALANLTHLDVSDNTFTGTIPQHFFEMTNLLVLDVHDNDFTAMPSQFQSNTKMELLALQKNQFSNQKLPASISQLSALQHLDVSQNKFTGAIPTEIGNLKNLTYLFFADNSFTPGGIPNWVQGLTKIEELSFKSTQRNGPIPQFLGTLSKLILLDLDDNQLQGAIPSNLGDLDDLHILLLNRNNLTSAIPTSFGGLRSLKLFFVETNNDITGNLNDLFCANPSFLMKPVLVADCALCNVAAPECCTACCEQGQECNPGIHVPDLDPIWQLSYQRVFFTFGREDYFDKEKAEKPATNNP